MSSLLFLVVLSAAQAGDVDLHADGVNLRIGDLSAVVGYVPSLDGLPPEEAERLRVRGHLLFAHDMLATLDTSDWPASRRAARAVNLERLRSYAEAGRFPHNDDHRDAMRPTFVDQAGTICAVGTLFAADRGRAAAQRIAGSHKYSFIVQIDDPELIAWQQTSGLSVTDLALIQPSYPGQRPRPVPRRELPWLSFGLLDRMQYADTRISAATELGSADVAGTTSVTLHGQTSFSGLGLYATLPAWLPLGSSDQTGAAAPRSLGNSELGVFGGSEELLRLGIVIPTAPRTVGRRFASARVGDAVIELPRSIGARFAISKVERLSEMPEMVQDELPRIEAGYRVDVGVDAVMTFAGDEIASSSRIIPRAGIGVLIAPQLVTLSLQTAIALVYDTSRATHLRWSAGVTIEPDMGMRLQPAVTVAAVRTADGWGGTLSLDLATFLPLPQVHRYRRFDAD